MEKILTVKELLDSKVICSKYLSNVSGVSYHMLRHFSSQTKQASDYHIDELNKALKEIANELNNITIVNETDREKAIIRDRPKW